MNIWALKKDARIKRVLLLLSEQLGAQRFVINETAVMANDAVRLSANDDSGFSIYLYTYGQAQNHYGVELEYPQQTEIGMSQPVETQDNLSFQQLLNLLQMHFF